MKVLRSLFSKGVSISGRVKGELEIRVIGKGLCGGVNDAP